MGTSSTPKKKKKEMAKIIPVILKTLEKVSVSKLSKYVVRADHSKMVNSITMHDSTNSYELRQTQYTNRPITRTP